MRSPLTRLGVALSLARPEARGTTREHLRRSESETETMADWLLRSTLLGLVVIADNHGDVAGKECVAEVGELIPENEF